MGNIIFSLGIIFLGLSLGYVIQILVHSQIISIPFDIQTLRKKLQTIALLFMSPIVFLGAVWIINFDELEIIVLPFIGIIALSLGGVLAFVFARLLKLSRKQTGSYVVSGGFTNIGSIGGLICFTFLGEAGFALVSFYKFFETFSYYAIGFPIAKSYGDDVTQSESFGERAKKIFADPFVVLATTSMLTGIVLNISGVERPEIFSGIIAIFVPVASILLLSSIGMAMSFSRAGKYIKEGLLIALVKFAIVPTVAMTISYFLGLGNINHGLPLKVVLILSSMPVGFTAMVPPTIYDLDVDLANASWIVTNISLIVVVPILQYLITLF
jgi:predicted permease